MHAQVQKGKASYYSKRATGARTSSGERLHHDSLTCAHRTYPFGTMLKVTNPENDRSVVVRVTDRGPHLRSRIIDLSWAAAKQLGIIERGVAMVVVEAIDNYIVPFKPNSEVYVPELDFGSTEYTYTIPEKWKERLRKPKDTKTAEKKEKKATEKKPRATVRTVPTMRGTHQSTVKNHP